MRLSPSSQFGDATGTRWNLLADSTETTLTPTPSSRRLWLDACEGDIWHLHVLLGTLSFEFFKYSIVWQLRGISASTLWVGCGC